MLRIAVCDDDGKERAYTAELLQEYFDAHREKPAAVSLFAGGAALLSAVEDKGGFDIYFLDVLMPGENGIQVGQRLRALGDGGAIIYLTASPDYAVDSYLTEAFFYLLKPVAREKLFPVLDRVLIQLQKRKDESTIVNTPEGLRSIPLESILYLECWDRSVRYHLQDGETVDSRTLRQSFRAAVTPLLEDRRFFSCGASFVLGLHHVRAVGKSEVLLDSGARVPVSRNAYSAVKKAWMDYWLGGKKA